MTKGNVAGALAVAALLGGCYRGSDGGRPGADPTAGSSDGGDDGADDGVPADAVPSGPTGLRLLTPAQYANSVVDILGDVAAEPVGQWRSSIAAAQGGVSPAGVEDYETAAMDLTGQIFDDATKRMDLTGCTPQLVADDPCTREVIATIGRRAWRRPLDDAELERYTSVARDVGQMLGNDPWVGMRHAVAGLLQSPSFLYRTEIGTPFADDPDFVRLDGYEVASRLSYLLWNTTPDDALLDAAAAGELDDADGRRAQIDRLLASPRAREGIVQVFVDMFDLDALDSLQKDAVLLPAFTPTIGPAMRAELVRVIEDTVIDQADFRRLFDTKTGYVDAELASLYGLPGTFGPEPTAVELPAGRGGVLTLPGFLAVHSGEASTSPTKRGLAIRLAVMCQTIPPPPPDVEADLPDPIDGQPQTKRQQLEAHATDPVCAACHSLTDPIGLALEHYDALGGWRETDQGLTIDPSGTFDGTDFADAVELGTHLAEHPQVAECMVKNLYRYAVGHIEQPEEDAAIDALVEVFEDSGWDLSAVIAELGASEGFRIATAPVDEGQGP